MTARDRLAVMADDRDNCGDESGPVAGSYDTPARESSPFWPGGIGPDGMPLFNRINDAAASARVNAIKPVWLPRNA